MPGDHFCKEFCAVCIDWRLHPEAEEFLKEKYGKFDLCVTAGSIKGFLEEGSVRDFLLEQIEISQNLHGSNVVVLTMHQDCGAFGGSKSFENGEAEFLHHKNVLNTAANIILKRFPETIIEKYFIELKNEGKEWISVFKNA